MTADAPAPAPKPDFFWIGQGKSGSSLAYKVLRRHPEIFLGTKKEHNVFNRKAWADNAAEYYAKEARRLRPGRRFGDISPSYYKNHERIDRLAAFYADGPLPQIIFCVRNPASFIYSRFAQILKIGKFLDGNDWPADINSFARREFLDGPTTLERLTYALERLGGPQNFLLLVYEEDFAGSYAFEDRIYKFLRVDPTARRQTIDVEQGVNVGIMPRFLMPARRPRRLVFGGERFTVPAGSAVFLSLPHTARAYEAPTPALLEAMARANEQWREPLAPDVLAQIDERLTQPLAAFVKETFGRDTPSWTRAVNAPAYAGGAPPRELKTPSLGEVLRPRLRQAVARSNRAVRTVLARRT